MSQCFVQACMNFLCNNKCKDATFTHTCLLKNMLHMITKIIINEMYKFKQEIPSRSRMIEINNAAMCQYVTMVNNIGCILYHGKTIVIMFSINA